METNDEDITIYKTKSGEEVGYVPGKKIMSCKFCDNNNNGFEIDFLKNTIKKISKNKTVVYYNVNKIDFIKGNKTNSVKIEPIDIKGVITGTSLPIKVQKYFNSGNGSFKDCFTKMNLSSFPIASIEETINVSGNENDINNKIYLTIDNINNKVDCKYISDAGSFEIINQNNDTEFKLNGKPIGINQLNQINKTNQPDQVNQIIENLLSKSRCNGDFGLENSLINGKLALLNAKRRNDDVQIIPMGWSEETQRKEYNMITKRLKGISNGLVLIPIFSNCHVSTLIIEKKNNKIVKCAFFDSSTDHLSENKSQIKEDILDILPDSIKSKEIVVLNRDDLQILNQSSSKNKQSSDKSNEKSKLIRLGNCSYYTLNFMEYIITNSCDYQSIDKIYSDIDSIKKKVQNKVDEELGYYVHDEVLKKFLENRQRQGNLGSRPHEVGNTGQSPEEAHDIIANKFKCFNSNIEQPIQQDEAERQQNCECKQIQSGNNIIR